MRAAPEAAFSRLEREDAERLASFAEIERIFSVNEESVLFRQAPAAAVLLPLVSRDETAVICCIRRALQLRSNPGDVAFPGGRLEPGETALDAALRETAEEIALPPERLRLLGALPPVTRASRTGVIAPFVAAVEGEPELVAFPPEVDECLYVPVREVLDPALYWEEEWLLGDGRNLVMHFFDRGEDVIWGASARILVALLERLAAHQ